MMETHTTLKANLDEIRESGIRKKFSREKIVRQMIAHLNEYKKTNTLSIREYESLVKENKELTQKMLARIEKIKSLTGV
jgi:hypothetical protein